jgi:NAD(P)-dependent dehydrogenase (short-subunit alcohol dehydrogenase family)
MDEPASRSRRHLLQRIALLAAALPVASFGKERSMRRIFITGSTDGLGRGAAETLIKEGHQVVLHARSKERATALKDLSPRAAGVVIGDLASAAQTRSLAEQVNKVGRMDAVIHNAGIYREPNRGTTPDGHAKVLAVNVLAPFILTAHVERPDRLIYLSSSMHRSGEGTLDDIDWSRRPWDTHRAYAESKLYITALAFAVARHWSEVASNAVDPGWVPTKMGGRGAPDDLEEGHLTQTWLATSDEPAAKTSGGLWYHRERQKPADQVLDHRFQDELIDSLARLTGTRLF